MTEVNFKAKAEMSIVGSFKLSAGNIHSFGKAALDCCLTVAKMLMLNSCKLYWDTNKHKPATG